MDDAHLSLAKRLAHSSDKSIRDDAFRTLGSWLQGNKGASEEEFMKLWKALFYCVWYSDKTPVQQELVFNVARLTRLLHGDLARAILFLRASFATLQREWMGIDHLRLDKFLSLLRRLLHEVLFLAVAHKWSAAAVDAAVGLLNDVLTDRPNGVRYHLVDCLLDEIAASCPLITTPRLQQLLLPLYSQCIQTDDKYLVNRIYKEVLQGLLQRVTTANEAAAAADGGAGAAKAAQSPLLADLSQRALNQARAFKKVDLVPFAQDVFAIAALSATQPGHRERLYALHAEVSAAARALGQAADDKATYPADVGAPTEAVRLALQLATKRVGKKAILRASVVPAVEAAVGAAAAASSGAAAAAAPAVDAASASGSKRPRPRAAAVADEGSAEPAAAPSAARPKKPRRADKGRADSEAAAAEAETSPAAVAAAASAKSGAKSASRRRSAAPVASADDDDAGIEAVLNSIPTVAALQKQSAAKSVAAPAAAAASKGPSRADSKAPAAIAPAGKSKGKGKK